MVNNFFEVLELKISLDSSGQRLDRLLGDLDKVKSRSRAAHLISNGLVRVNGKIAKASFILKENDLVEVQIPERPTSTQLKPYNFKLDIVHEDPDLLVINKPAGLVVHPAAGHLHDTLVNALLNYTNDLSMGFNELRPGIVHRIDRDTSGLLVVAKNDFSHMELSKQFKLKTTHRVYWALVFGSFRNSSGTITSKVARHPTDRKRYSSTSGNGRMAITHYKILNNYKNEISLLELKLETGRTHQIRIHCSEQGHPIVGDTLYGAKSRTKNVKAQNIRDLILSMNRFALHAHELGFQHPRTKEALLFRAKWPLDLIPLVSELGFDKENSL